MGIQGRSGWGTVGAQVANAIEHGAYWAPLWVTRLSKTDQLASDTILLIGEF
jgi:hypothetical protein